jgi:hypothetical protein
MDDLHVEQRIGVVFLGRVADQVDDPRADVLEAESRRERIAQNDVARVREDLDHHLRGNAQRLVDIPVNGHCGEDRTPSGRPHGLDTQTGIRTMA